MTLPGQNTGYFLTFIHFEDTSELGQEILEEQNIRILSYQNYGPLFWKE